MKGRYSMYIRCDCQLKNTRCIQYAYKWNEFPFEVLKKDIVKSGKHKMYQRHPMTFDIETSKIPTDDEADGHAGAVGLEMEKAEVDEIGEHESIPFLGRPEPAPAFFYQ